MVEWLMTVFSAIQTNPIVAGLFGTTLIGGLILSLKNIPMKIFNFIKGRFVITITIYEATEYKIYHIIESKLCSYSSFQISKNYTISYPTGSADLQPAPIFAPGIATASFIKLEGIWCIIHKHVDEASKMDRKCYYSLSFLAMNNKTVLDMLLKLYEEQVHVHTQKFFRIYTYNDYWSSRFKRKINIENINLNKDQMCIFDKISEFINYPEKWYDKNITHREGFLFYGEPGCGKTFFTSVIASQFNLDIYYFNLNNFRNEIDFVSAMDNINFPAIVLIEDIDCCESDITETRETDGTDGTEKLKINLKTGSVYKSKIPKSNISLSTILNVCDGMLSRDGQIIIVTTNHIERLDPALIRSGRFNTKIEFKKYNYEDINKELMLFYNCKDQPNCLLTKEDNIELPIVDVIKYCSCNDDIYTCCEYIKKNHK